MVMTMASQTLYRSRTILTDFFSRTRLRLSNAQDEEGSAIIELAWSSAIMLSVVFGIMAISVGLYSYNFVSNAAREATRYAIVRGNTFTTDCTAPGFATCIAQQADILAYVQG